MLPSTCSGAFCAILTLPGLTSRVEIQTTCASALAHRMRLEDLPCSRFDITFPSGSVVASDVREVP